MKYKVKYVKAIGDGSFGGLNCYAAKDLKMHYPYSYNTIVILAGQSRKLAKETILHEILEAELMRQSEMHYKKAHKFAEGIERNLRT